MYEYKITNRAVPPYKVLFLTSQWPSSEHPSIAPFVKREVEALRRGGVDINVLIYDGGWSLTKYIRAISRMRKEISRHNYDLIHARFGQCGLVARAQNRIPVIITYGGSDIEAKAPAGSPPVATIKYLFLRLISRSISLFVDEVIVVSDHLGKQLFRHDYHVVPSGIDLELFHPSDKHKARSQLGLPQDKRLVLFVTSDPQKRIKRLDLAQAACDYARQILSDLDLIVLTNRPAEEVPVYMNACDALILTSSNEGSPNVIKEALACNLPVISVNVGDIRARISGIAGCVLCEDNKPETIAAGLIQVLTVPQRLKSVHTIVSLEQHTQAHKVILLYEQVLNPRV